MKRHIIWCGMLVLSLTAVYGLSGLCKAAEKNQKQLLRVGVYDSRAIAIAYGHSDHWDQTLKVKMEEMEKAKAAGDQQKVQELEQWGSEKQHEAHLKAFGTAPVHELFEPVKDKLPEVAQQADADMIVSKWDLDYLAPDAQTVDVTNALVQLYNPKERALKIIKELDTWKPLSREAIEGHDH